MSLKKQDPRLSLNVDSKCCIYSRSNKQWLSGNVQKIFIDPNDNKEWLVVKYGKKKKKIQRFCADLRANIDRMIEQKKDEIQQKQHLETITLTLEPTAIPFEWKQLASLELPEGESYSELLVINNEEFVIATEVRKAAEYDPMYGIYKYNTKQNEWDLWVNFDKIWASITRIDSLLIDEIFNQIYIFGGGYMSNTSYIGDPHRTIKIDNMHDMEWDLIDYIYVYYGKKFGIKPFYANNLEYHVLGRNKNDELEYTIWNTMNKQCIGSYLSILDGMGYHLYEDGKSIYLESQCKLLIFNTVHIWCYNLRNHEWMQLNDLPSHYLGYNYNICLSSDERYVIFISKIIAVLDLVTMTCYGGGCIPLPSNGSLLECVIIADYPYKNVKSITNGYIKKNIICNKEIDYSLIKCPTDLIELISIFWFNEYLYVLDKTTSRYDPTPSTLWRIAVADILQSNMHILQHDFLDFDQ